MFDLKIKIPFSGLSEGDHQFNFAIDDHFFQQFEASEIQKGKVEINVLLKKSSRLMVLETALKGVVEVMCDRCLDIFDLKIEYKDKIFIKTGENVEDSTDEIMIIHESDSELNLGHYIYESVHLGLPYKKEHPKNEKGERACNREMIEKLSNHLAGDDRNGNDLRWDKLKDII